MNRFNKLLLSLLFLAVIYFIFFHKSNFVHENSAISDIKEEIDIPETESDCDFENMKWRGHLKYASGPFYELNLVRESSDLDQLLRNKESVKILKLTSKNLKELPEKIFQFKNLEALDISDNPFTDFEKLMKDLSKFPKLELLAMSHCGIIRLPDNISLLNGLIGLSLDQNIHMIEVNENLGKLNNLRYLNFRRNKKLKDLPESIGNLQCLEQIILSGAGFTRIREEVSSCINLVDITANASKIKTIPNAIGKLNRLRTLNLAYNKIESLPESIGQLFGLKYLSLSWNELANLPTSLSNLKNLKRLSLEFNRFNIVPQEISKLSGLRYLNLHNSSYKEIPLEIGDLPNLIRVYVDHELISDQNIELLKKRNPDLVVERRDELIKSPNEPKRKN